MADLLPDRAASPFPAGVRRPRRRAVRSGALALLGIVVRGAAFAFAAQLTGFERARRPLHLAFGLASAVTPVAVRRGSGRARARRLHVRGTHVRAGGGAALWLGPFQAAVGLLALAACVALAAAFMTVECAARATPASRTRSGRRRCAPPPRPPRSRRPAWPRRRRRAGPAAPPDRPRPARAAARRRRARRDADRARLAARPRRPRRDRDRDGGVHLGLGARPVPAPRRPRRHRRQRGGEPRRAPRDRDRAGRRHRRPPPALFLLYGAFRRHPTEVPR